MKNKVYLEKSWIEISKSSLLKNLHTFGKLVGKNCEVCCVVKANAYGHGLKEITKILKGGNVRTLAVDSTTEALLVRSQRFKGRIIILGYVRLSEIKSVVEKNISFIVYNRETVQSILDLNLTRKARIHLKCETGLNRQGLKKDELLDLTELILKHKDKIIIEGISTHFANVEDTLNPLFTRSQLKKFQETVASLEKMGLKKLLKHSTASAGALLYKNTHFNMIRLGISLYGLWPSKKPKIAFQRNKKKLELYPVLTWKSIVAQVKSIKPGESVGYGRSWIASKDSRIAIIPIGYSDGYDRKLSNLGRVIINGKVVPVIGRVAMNMIVVDVTGLSKVNLEDEVILIGSTGNKEITVEEVADKTGTINYEVVARISPNLRRIVV